MENLCMNFVLDTVPNYPTYFDLDVIASHIHRKKGRNILTPQSDYSDTTAPN